MHGPPWQRASRAAHACRAERLILVLFCFILVPEESGYLPRAAFLLDRMMVAVGLTGRAFIPLLSSFACACRLRSAARLIE